MSAPSLFFNATYPVVAPMFRYELSKSVLVGIKSGDPLPVTQGNLAGTNWDLRFDGKELAPGSLGIGHPTVTGGFTDMMSWNYTGTDVFVNRITNTSYPINLVIHLETGYLRGRFLIFDETSQWRTKLNYTQHQTWYYFIPSIGPPPMVTVNNVTLTHGLATNATRMDQVPITTEQFVVDGKLNSNMIWHADLGSAGPAAGTAPWTVNTTLAPAINSGQAPIDYISAAVDDGNVEGHAHVLIYPPKNTSFVVVNGTIGPGYGTWQFYFSQNISFPVTDKPMFPDPQMLLVNTSHIYVVPNVPLLSVPLDPTLQYAISVQQPIRLGQARTIGGLSSVTYYSAIPKVNDQHNATTNGTDTNNGTDSDTSDRAASHSDGVTVTKGAIAGIVVAIVAALLIIAAVAWWCVRRRDQRRKPLNEDFVVDATAEARAVPFEGDLLSPGSASIMSSTKGAGYAPEAYAPNAPNAPIYSYKPWGAPNAQSGSSQAGSSQSGTTPLVRPAIHEVDASEVVDETTPERLPPMYKASWAPVPSASWAPVASSSSAPASDYSPAASESAPFEPPPLARVLSKAEAAKRERYENELPNLPSDDRGPIMSTPMMFGESGASKPGRPQ